METDSTCYLFGYCMYLYNCCHNLTQQQLNLTWLRLDIIIKPNTAWRQHKVSLVEAHIRLSEELATTGYIQVKEGLKQL